MNIRTAPKCFCSRRSKHACTNRILIQTMAPASRPQHTQSGTKGLRGTRDTNRKGADKTSPPESSSDKLSKRLSQLCRIVGWSNSSSSITWRLNLYIATHHIRCIPCPGLGSQTKPTMQYLQHAMYVRLPITPQCIAAKIAQVHYERPTPSTHGRPTSLRTHTCYHTVAVMRQRMCTQNILQHIYSLSALIKCKNIQRSPPQQSTSASINLDRATS